MSIRRGLSIVLFGLTMFHGVGLFGQGGMTVHAIAVEVELMTDGSIDVKEHIEVQFDEPRRGIFRNIPLDFKLNGKKKSINIKSIDVSNRPFKAYVENGEQFVRIGHRDKYLNGYQEYDLQYQVPKATIGYKEHNELYWNAVGDWEQAISDVSLVLTVPSYWIADSMIVKVIQGRGGASIDTIISGDANQYTIEGVRLDQGDQLTIAAKIPKGWINSNESISSAEEGYQENRNRDWMALIPAFLLSLLFGLWRRFEQKQAPQTVDRIHCYPPPLPSEQLGYFIDNRLGRRDVISMMPQWANRGYISMEPVTEKSDDLALTKLGQLSNQEPKYAHVLFDALFDAGDQVHLSDLQYKLTGEIGAIGPKIKSKIRDRFYDEQSMLWFHSGYFYLILFLSAIAGIVLIVALQALYAGIGFILLSVVGLVLTVLRPKFSDEGRLMIAETQSFYDFLSEPDPKLLKKVIDENPSYLTEIYPYVVAFGLDKQWESHVKKVNYAVAPLFWQGDRSSGRSFSDYIPQIEQVFQVDPAQQRSGGSSSSGGGFAGGGLGGGGGGSW